MLIKTEDLRPDSPLEPSLSHQVYCGLDCAVMSECFQEVQRQYREKPRLIYEFEKALQGPYLDIMLRGFLVDQQARLIAARRLHERIDFLTLRLNALALAVWQKPLIRLGTKLPHSSVLQDFFYGAMRLPEIYIYQKGQRKLSANREALERLESYVYARPFISLLLSLRDLYKQLQVFETSIDDDGRFRTSYNIAGTETGRPSSSENSFGTGGNAQNISPGLRYCFIADAGWKLAVIDLEQVEARDVGFFIGCLFSDWSYLDSCENGNLHVNNSRLVWPELPWTGDPKDDRQIADRIFYRGFSHYDMSKRGGHLSNYMGTAYTASRALKVPQAIMEDFQARYCRGSPPNPKRGLPGIDPAFPGIPRFWQWTSEQLQTKGWLETPFGRRRHFFGDPRDDTTLREGIAYLPQSTTADRMNLGLWRVWKGMPQVQLLAQTYDSITFQYREAEDEEAIIEEALERIRVHLRSPSGRDYVVPGEAKTGWNWQNTSEKNPDGLKKWNPQEPDKRVRQVSVQRFAS
jgi:DNA polymerase I-like protein with 3'-5' exonuclease and polymerase domains